MGGAQSSQENQTVAGERGGGDSSSHAHQARPSQGQGDVAHATQQGDSVRSNTIENPPQNHAVAAGSSDLSHLSQESIDVARQWMALSSANNLPRAKEVAPTVDPEAIKALVRLSQLV